MNITDQRLRFICAGIIVGTHVIVPILVLFTDFLAFEFDVRVEFALTIAPVTFIYVSIITIFSVKNLNSTKRGEKVSDFSAFFIIILVLGFASTYWLTFWNANDYGNTDREVIDNLKKIISVIEIFYAGIFAIIMDSLFENSK